MSFCGATITKPTILIAFEMPEAWLLQQIENARRWGITANDFSLTPQVFWILQTAYFDGLDADIIRKIDTFIRYSSNTA